MVSCTFQLMSQVCGSSCFSESFAQLATRSTRIWHYDLAAVNGEQENRPLRVDQLLAMAPASTGTGMPFPMFVMVD